MKQMVDKQQWLDWIDEQEQSELSIAAFCRNNSINADNFYYHRGQHRKKALPDSSSFIRAQVDHESAVTPFDVVKVEFGNLTMSLPLCKPFQVAQLIKALQ